MHLPSTAVAHPQSSTVVMFPISCAAPAAVHCASLNDCHCSRITTARQTHPVVLDWLGAHIFWGHPGVGCPLRARIAFAHISRAPVPAQRRKDSSTRRRHSCHLHSPHCREVGAKFYNMMLLACQHDPAGPARLQQCHVS
jgi:hypothetical protein